MSAEPTRMQNLTRDQRIALELEATRQRSVGMRILYGAALGAGPLLALDLVDDAPGAVRAGMTGLFVVSTLLGCAGLALYWRAERTLKALAAPGPK